MEDLLIKELLINDQIRFGGEVRLVGENGEQLGIVSVLEAKKIATQKSLDLALISPNATPPVCKVMNYGKYRYEVQKKEKEAQVDKLTEMESPSFDANLDIVPEKEEQLKQLGVNFKKEDCENQNQVSTT